MTESNKSKDEVQGTNVQRFLAQRGAVIIKETKEIGKVQGKFSHAILVSAMKVTVGQGSEQATSYGIKLIHSDENRGTEVSVFLDFDELEEVIDAFNFIASSSQEFKNQQREYTEVTYSTKDNAQFGFYQKEQNQQAFIQLLPSDSLVFFALEKLDGLKSHVNAAKEYLSSCR